MYTHALALQSAEAEQTGARRHAAGAQSRILYFSDGGTWLTTTLPSSEREAKIHASAADLLGSACGVSRRACAAVRRTVSFSDGAPDGSKDGLLVVGVWPHDAVRLDLGRVGLLFTAAACEEGRIAARLSGAAASSPRSRGWAAQTRSRRRATA